MHIVLAILIGGVTGLIFRLIAPGHQPRNVITSVAIGVVGAVIAEYAIHRIDCCIQNGPVDLIGAIIGSLILLNIDRFARGKPQ